MFDPTGLNGSRSDKALFNNSSLKKSIEDGLWLNGQSVLVAGVPIREGILADAGFANNNYNICPYNMMGI